MLRPSPLIGLRRRAPLLSYRTAVGTGSDSASYSGAPFNGLDIGAARDDRIVVAAVMGTGTVATTLSSVSCAGNAMAIQAQGSGAARGVAAIATLRVPSGSTANFVITPSATWFRCAIAIWALYGLSPTARRSATSNGTNSIQSLDIHTRIGEVLISAAYDNGDVSPPSCSWTGLTERFDNDFSAEGSDFSGGDFTPIAHESPRTITATFSVGGSRGAGVACTFM